MARLIRRVWKGPGPNGHKIRKVSWGYSVQVDGKQERHVCAAWSKEEAQAELAGRILERDAPKEPPKPKTLGEVAQEYLEFKKGGLHQNL